MISIVIPAFNEAENICDLLFRLKSIFHQLNLAWEVVVIDDHSQDETYRVVEQLRWPEARVLKLSRRSGSHVALRAGLAAAKGDCVVCMAADGQDDPNVLPLLLEKWSHGNKIVWALRRSRGDSFLNRLFALGFYKLLSLLSSEGAKKIDLSRADFYLLDRAIVNALNSCSEQNTSLFGLIAWMGFKQSFIEYDRPARRSGKSKWNFGGRFRLAVDWIIAFSDMPLKLILLMGVSLAFLGFLYALVVLHAALFGHPVQGWSSIMIAVLIMGGVQLCTIGIIGEYVLRNLNEARKRPLYFIEEASDNEGQPNGHIATQSNLDI